MRFTLPFLVTTFAVFSSAQTAPTSERPKVIMIQPDGGTPGEGGLYKAIRAQLSASPVILDRVAFDGEERHSPVTVERARAAVRDHGADLAFWIEDETPCTMSFFINNSLGGRLNTQTLDVKLSTDSSRFEVIALVAADAVERLLASRVMPPAPPPPVRDEPKEAVPDIQREKPSTKRRHFEIAAAYAGSLIAEGAVTHGILIGFGGFPIERLAVAASYTQGFYLRVQNDDVQLTLLSRQIEILAAGRIVTKPLDVRLGFAWSVDVRSVSATPETLTIRTREDRIMGIHSLSPFVSAAWVYHDRIGIVGRIGVNLTVNETRYTVSHPDGTQAAFDPFIAKPAYQLGGVVRF